MVAAVIELVDIASLRRLWRVRTGRLASVYRLTSRIDFVAAAATLLGVLLFETLPGLVIGIGVSLALLIARTSRPHIAVLVPVPQPEDRALDAGPDLGRLRTQPRPSRGSRDPGGQGRGTRCSSPTPTSSRAHPAPWSATPSPPPAPGRPGRADHSLHRRHRGRHARPAPPGPAPPRQRPGAGRTTSGRYATSLLSPNRTTSRPCTSRSRRRSQRRLSRETGPDPGADRGDAEYAPRGGTPVAPSTAWWSWARGQ